MSRESSVNRNAHAGASAPFAARDARGGPVDRPKGPYRVPTNRDMDWTTAAVRVDDDAVEAKVGGPGVALELARAAATAPNVSA